MKESSRIIALMGYGWRVETIKSLLPSEKETWPLSDEILVAVARATPGPFERNLYLAYSYYRMGETQADLAKVFKTTQKAVKSIIFRMNQTAHTKHLDKFLPSLQASRVITSTLGSVHYKHCKNVKS